MTPSLPKLTRTAPHVTKPIDPDELFDVLVRWLPDRADHSSAGREPSPETPAPQPVPPAAPILHVPGLDVADGLRRVLGRREAYLGLLRRFAIGHANDPREIRSALADGRHADADRAAHTLKGVAGSIGARELQREAGDLEVALRGGVAPGEALPLIDAVERRLGDLISALLRTLPPEPETEVAVSVEPAALAAAVERLEQLLSSDAAEAIDAFDEAGQILAAAFGDRATQIGKLVRDFRFEDALAALREVSGR